MEKRIILIFIITLCFILSVKGQNTSPIQKIKESIIMSGSNVQLTFSIKKTK